MTNAAGSSGAAPGRRMISTPAIPQPSITRRETPSFSPRNKKARSAVHTGIVNSMANTVARGSAPIA